MQLLKAQFLSSQNDEIRVLSNQWMRGAGGLPECCQIDKDILICYAYWSNYKRNEFGNKVSKMSVMTEDKQL